MSKHKSVGGLGYPIIFDYYIATLLSQLKPWFNPAINKQWMVIERYFVPNNNSHLFLIHSKLPQESINNLSPLTKASIQAWSVLMNKLSLCEDLKEIPITLQTLELLSPALNLNNWSKNGINYISDLCVDNIMLSFNYICCKFLLPKTEFFTYLRIKSIINKGCNPSLYLPPQLCSYLFDAPLATKGITLCYNL